MGLRNRPRTAFRPGWTLRQERRLAYMSSPAWWERRRRWQADEETRTGLPVVCAITGRLWDPDRDDLHHVTYARLGHEAHDDLIALTRAAHERLHRLVDATPAIRRALRTNPFAITEILIFRLRKEHDDRDPR